MRNEQSNADVNPFKAIRDKHNITWRDIPHLFDISFVTVREVERGQIATPRKYAMELERAGLIESAYKIIAEHQKWCEREKERVTREFFQRMNQKKAPRIAPEAERTDISK